MTAVKRDITGDIAFGQLHSFTQSFYDLLYTDEPFENVPSQLNYFQYYDHNRVHATDGMATNM